jgi:hypothetical protein
LDVNNCTNYTNYTNHVSWWDIRTALVLRGATEEQCGKIRERVFLLLGKVLQDRMPIPGLCLRSMKMFAPTVLGEEKTKQLVEDILQHDEKGTKEWKKV